MAAGANGQKDGKAMDSYIHKIWKAFTAEWARRTDIELPAHVINSGANWIKNEGELDTHIPINRDHAENDFVTLIHFQNLLTQLWENDWHIFRFPIYRVYLSSLLKLCMYSSGRVGEYVESSSRTGTGRGLCIEEGMPELVFTPRRDAKGMSKRQEKCPRHPMQEDISPLPLYLNPVLEPPAICLARGLFRDYKTADKILAINPPPNSPCIELVLHTPTNRLSDDKSCGGEENLHINSKHPKKRKSPFFDYVTARGLTGKTLKSKWLSEQFSLLGQRLGYGSMTIHNIRREALMVADVNGVSNILNLPRRYNIHEHLRGLSLRRNPTLHQTLPAQLQHDLKKCHEYVKIESKIEDISERIKATPPPGEHQRELQNERRGFYSERSKLLDQELDKWQKQQILDCKPGAKDEDSSALSYLESFERVSHLMPERKRLSKLLFMPVPLRSPEGRQAIKDMVTLCQKGSAVSDHPALMLENADTEPNNDSLIEEYTSKLIKWLEAWDKVQKANTTQNLCTQPARVNSLEEALQREVHRNKALKVCLARKKLQIEKLQQTIEDRKNSTHAGMRLLQILEREVELLNQDLFKTRFFNDKLKNQNKNLQEVNRQTFLGIGEHKKLLEDLCVKLGIDFDKIMRDVVKEQSISLPAGWTQ
ncbi:hypothetical protein TEQG_01412 [Trichophyton equinum CBS 127.97]|uniref:Uncharacterized protein n=1 Tax=Trichophyton equinum (strain ATCC MYA-4606 / CBS 127.97) TaxID=559882 RepID=F2PKF5_TRIEC|nr:hypothetical protein TEQG_01412 [Trichophyton equinum CBS 127.97]